MWNCALGELAACELTDVIIARSELVLMSKPGQERRKQMQRDASTKHSTSVAEYDLAVKEYDSMHRVCCTVGICAPLSPTARTLNNCDRNRCVV